MGTLKRFDLRQEKEREMGLQEAAEAVQRGQLLLFPTDTLYGIGGNALNEETVERVLEAKDRPKSKPLLVLIPNLEFLEFLCSPLSPWQKHCCELLWPGPITFLLPSLPGLCPGIALEGKIGVRLPRGQPVGQILQAVDRPLVAPSANRSGEPPASTVDEALSTFSAHVEVVLDNGRSACTSPSTVVDLQEDAFSVIRPGLVSEGEIRKALERIPRKA